MAAHFSTFHQRIQSYSHVRTRPDALVRTDFYNRCLDSQLANLSEQVGKQAEVRTEHSCTARAHPL